MTFVDNLMPCVSNFLQCVVYTNLREKILNLDVPVKSCTCLVSFRATDICHLISTIRKQSTAKRKVITDNRAHSLEIHRTHRVCSSQFLLLDRTFSCALKGHLS